MKVINLGEKNSILNKFVAQLRDREVQKDSMRFRRNLERLGEIFAYEISKTLNAPDSSVMTPLGIANIPVYDESITKGRTSILKWNMQVSRTLQERF